MILRKKVIVVMPAYNASKTIAATYKAMPPGVVDETIVVDDKSSDNTVQVARELGLTVIMHPRNLGYGGNQKTCYKEALKRGADVVVMIHPDYQYDSSLTEEIAKPISQGRFDIMFGSRIRTRKEALDGGMPYVKYILNRVVSLIENIVLGVNFTEHLSGFRAYSKEVLNTLPINHFSDDFLFDQELMISAIAHGFRVAEYPVPVRYSPESSSIKFLAGTKFLLETFVTLALFILYKLKIYKSKIFA
ncbi:MAG TPA: glycosyltransferase family 2 protein [Patescibacteria group bacterium]|nr:glycosyltransferase family 2 protein [Patescibacteria group bacterium]